MIRFNVFQWMPAALGKPKGWLGACSVMALLACVYLFADSRTGRPTGPGRDRSRPLATKNPLQEKVQEADADEPEQATAVLAGGCFWCTQAAFEQLKGVIA